MIDPGNSFARFLLPRGLFGRTLLILIVPLIILQLVVAAVFAQRYIDGITRQMTTAVALDLRGYARLAVAEGDAEAVRTMLGRLSGGIDYDLAYLEGETFTKNPLPPWHRLAERAIAETLEEIIEYPVSIDTARLRKRVDVRQQLPGGVLLALPHERRLTVSNPHLLLVWMLVAAVVLLVVATMFLRNQVRPIRQLAVAAEAFGKGQPAPAFRPTGAEEVRRAAGAFQTMRARIERQISQRTLLLSGVSHDLRTPLTRMKLSLAMLDENQESKALKRDVDHMARMVDDFLAFARGERSEEAQPIDVHALVRGVGDDMRALGHSVTVETEANAVIIPLRAHAMRRALANLVENAVKYGSEVYVRVIAEPRHLAILVDDNGPGVPEDSREDIMRPFQRGDAARNLDSGEGSGLGLSIASQIAHAHGGSIILEESPEGGLRAGIHLPT